METPSVQELNRIAPFKVGDHVWTRSSGPWVIVKRWWLKREQCIAYDLEFPRNKVRLVKMRDIEVFATQQNNGTYNGR